jgi:hypothetical protein
MGRNARRLCAWLCAWAAAAALAAPADGAAARWRVAAPDAARAALLPSPAGLARLAAYDEARAATPCLPPYTRCFCHVVALPARF